MICKKAVVQIAALVFALPAQAEILSLDCTNFVNGQHIWVDLDKAVVTFPGWGGDIRSAHAEIAATSIAWNDASDFNGNGAAYTIDRSTGQLSIRTLRIVTGLPVAQCEKGTAPLPSVKF